MGQEGPSPSLRSDPEPLAKWPERCPGATGMGGQVDRNTQK